MIAAAPSARIGPQCAAQASDKLDQPTGGTDAKQIDNRTAAVADTSQPSSPTSGTTSSEARPRKRRKAEQAKERSFSGAGLPAQEDEQHYDTVGCICVDSNGEIPVLWISHRLSSIVNPFARPAQQLLNPIRAVCCNVSGVYSRKEWTVGLLLIHFCPSP